MGFLDWFKRRPADADPAPPPTPPKNRRPDPDKVTSWVRAQIADRARAGDALALADACATLNGHGSMLFGMVTSLLQNATELRDEALEQLRPLLPKLDDRSSQRVFEAIERGRLPIELGATRARLAAEQHATLATTIEAFREAVQITDAIAIAEAWSQLGYHDKVLGVAVVRRDDARDALRAVIRERLDELLPEVPDAEWLRVGQAITRWRIPVTYDLDARTTAVQATRRADSKSQLEHNIAGEPINDDLEYALSTNSDDDETYAVYADWLAERDHPRGELIALQLRGDPSLAPAIAAHIETHAGQLLGPLLPHRLVHDGSKREAFTWRRGFIHHARLSCAEYKVTDHVPEILELLVAHPSGRFLEVLDVGIDGDSTNSLEDVVKRIAALQPPQLRSLFLGDYIYEQAMISDFDLGNLVPLWGSRLRKLVLHGSIFELGAIDLPEAEHVAIQTGGLSPAAAQSIARARWPRLRHLDVWTGDPNYNGDTTTADLEPIMARTDLTELVHLGLMNCAFTDELCLRIGRMPLAGAAARARSVARHDVRRRRTSARRGRGVIPEARDGRRVADVCRRSGTRRAPRRVRERDRERDARRRRRRSLRCRGRVATRVTACRCRARNRRSAS